MMEPTFTSVTIRRSTRPTKSYRFLLKVDATHLCFESRDKRTPKEFGVVLLLAPGRADFGQTAMTGRVLPCTGVERLIFDSLVLSSRARLVSAVIDRRYRTADSK